MALYVIDEVIAAHDIAGSEWMKKSLCSDCHQSLIVNTHFLATLDILVITEILFIFGCIRVYTKVISISLPIYIFCHSAQGNIILSTGPTRLHK